MNNKPRLAYRTTALMPYRKAVISRWQESYEVTIYADRQAYTTPLFQKYKRSFKVMGLEYRSISGSFDSDVIIAEFNLRRLDLWLLILFFPNKLILWGIGVRASYSNRYAENDWLLPLRKLIVRRVSKVVFYSWPPYIKYSTAPFKVPTQKLSVFNNSDLGKSNVGKNLPCDYRLVFIGSVNKSKNLNFTLDEIIRFNETTNKKITISIIGDGPLLDNLKFDYREEEIQFFGRVEEDDEIFEIIQDCHFGVSLGQAGLSVMKTMQFGIPFVTVRNCYTGGERNNILHLWNGVLLNKEADFYQFLESLDTFPLSTMRANCLEWYNIFRTKGFPL